MKGGRLVKREIKEKRRRTNNQEKLKGRWGGQKKSLRKQGRIWIRGKWWM